MKIMQNVLKKLQIKEYEGIKFMNDNEYSCINIGIFSALIERKSLMIILN
jgi:hypothetical protein